ncbi:MAG: class I SAM-dependent RNA methyltransferase [Myxococcaceae bacterium]|nr:class I SAM-dependent RNA methyltransferase [Myxococcaceae bacterium]MBH2006047.1 class I SAM-dependent RNA methyltransferase [Myxococcaceae bacterium]
MRLLNIEAIDDEGRGRAFYDAWNYAVRGAFPGDQVEVRVERIFKAQKLYVCRVKRFARKGEFHESRTCRHKLPCPACPLHGVKDSLVLELKQSRIQAALTSVALDLPVEAVVPHPSLTGYRQKVKLMVAGDPGDLRLGVYVPYSHQFSEASACPHVDPSINQAIPILLSKLNESKAEGLQAVILRAVQGGVAIVVVTLQPLPDVLFTDNPFLSFSERIQSTVSNNILAGEPGRQTGLQRVPSLEGGPSVHPDSFCQTDPIQAERLYDLVADFLYQGPGHYCDAYAGVGGFSKAILKKGEANLVAVESNALCIESLNELGIQVYGGSMAEYLSERSSVRWAGIVVDPPKKGLQSEACLIAALQAERVALISCDPNAMARDLLEFVRQGYQVVRIVPMDFFGGTPAVETVVLMRYSGEPQ